MKVSINDTKYYYNYLDYMFECSSEQIVQEDNSGESWKEEYKLDTDKQKSIKRIRFQAPPIELYYPLSKGVLILTRNFTHFSAFALITSRAGETPFENTSEFMDSFTNQSGNIFSPTTDSLTGYIIDKNNRAIASIYESKAGSGFIGRDIGIGCNGAEPLEFTTLSEFASAIKGLETIINNVVSSVYSPLERSGVMQLPDITISYLY